MITVFYATFREPNDNGPYDVPYRFIFDPELDPEDTESRLEFGIKNALNEISWETATEEGSFHVGFLLGRLVQIANLETLGISSVKTVDGLEFREIKLGIIDISKPGK